jgi:hypothetical protein
MLTSGSQLIFKWEINQNIYVHKPQLKLLKIVKFINKNNTFE